MLQLPDTGKQTDGCFVMRWVFSTNDSVTVTVYWKFPANAVVCTHAVVYDHLYVFPSIMFLLLSFLLM